LVGILTDKIETKAEKRKELKKAAVSLKKMGVSRIFGIGVGNAHDWDKKLIRKTWKSVVTRLT
jgi:hypothetical protein